jgi:gliding motility-associated-like protein
MGPCSDATFHNNLYSPSSVTLNADTELMTESLFATFEEPDTNNHYTLSVVLPTSAIAGFTLNGQNPPSSVFQAFPTDAAWSYAQFDLDPGVHKVVCPGGFHGYHYTWYQDSTTTGQFPSYGYNLVQSIVWPEDSLVPIGGTQPNNLSPWDSLSVAICPGDSFYFQAPPLRHTTWQWDVGNGQIFYQSSDEHRAPVLGYRWNLPGSYWLVLSDSLGCSSTNSLLITVQNEPNAQFNSQVITSCAGATVSIAALDVSADSYQWSWPGGGASGPSASFQYSGNADSVLVSLVITTQNCADSSSQYIAIPSSKQLPEDLPNVITPNGDLQNDVFSFDELESFKGCYSLRVFNRWGALVHEGTDVFSPFDGNDINGRELSEGVYFYQLELGGNRFQGEIHLFR